MVFSPRVIGPYRFICLKDFYIDIRILRLKFKNSLTALHVSLLQ